MSDACNYTRRLFSVPTGTADRWISARGPRFMRRREDDGVVTEVGGERVHLGKIKTDSTGLERNCCKQEVPS